MHARLAPQKFFKDHVGNLMQGRSARTVANDGLDPSHVVFVYEGAAQTWVLLLAPLEHVPEHVVLRQDLEQEVAPGRSGRVQSCIFQEEGIAELADFPSCSRRKKALILVLVEDLHDTHHRAQCFLQLRVLRVASALESLVNSPKRLKQGPHLSTLSLKPGIVTSWFLRVSEHG